MRDRWIDSRDADRYFEAQAEARDGYGPAEAEADHGSLDGPGEADPDEEYAGEGDAGRGAVQTTGEHLAQAQAVETVTGPAVQLPAGAVLQAQSREAAQAMAQACNRLAAARQAAQEAAQAPALWVVTFTYVQGTARTHRRKHMHHTYATIATDAAGAIAQATSYHRPDPVIAEAWDRDAGRTFTVEAEPDPDGVVSLGSYSTRPAHQR